MFCTWLQKSQPSGIWYKFFQVGNEIIFHDYVLNVIHSIYNIPIFIYRFPLKDPQKLELWIKAISRKGFVPNKASRLCSEHFKLCDFYENPGGSYKVSLKSEAVPSIFQFSVHSTLIPTKLFCNKSREKRIKIDNIAIEIDSSSSSNKTSELNNC